MRLALIILLLLLVVGLFPTWPYAAAWNLGWYPSGLLGLVLLIVILAAVFGSTDRPVV